MKRFKKILPRVGEEVKREAAEMIARFICEHPEALDELEEEVDAILLRPEPVMCDGSGRFCVWIPQLRVWEHPWCPGCPRCERPRF